MKMVWDLQYGRRWKLITVMGEGDGKRDVREEVEKFLSLLMICTTPNLSIYISFSCHFFFLPGKKFSIKKVLLFALTGKLKEKFSYLHPSLVFHYKTNFFIAKFFRYQYFPPRKSVRGEKIQKHQQTSN